uniref:Membrane transport protein MMPL domain-containing protein n=2 Tax=Chrysotila carterae TaxID=13221 RepID=A0A7S4EUM3_CHRCT
MFLLVRVREFWHQGYGTREAVCRAVHKTGNAINFAGAIMAIAFGGLFFSTTATLNQFACYLVAGTVYDTFVIRPFMVPALFSLTGEATWWPGVWTSSSGERLAITERIQRGRSNPQLLL